MKFKLTKTSEYWADTEFMFDRHKEDPTKVGGI